MARSAGRISWARPPGRVTASGAQPPERRHPMVALAMVLPLAIVLSVAFGGWEAVMTHASSAAGMMGR